MIVTSNSAYGSLSYGGFMEPGIGQAVIDNVRLNMKGDIYVAHRTEKITVKRRVANVTVAKRGELAVRSRRVATISFSPLGGQGG